MVGVGEAFSLPPVNCGGTEEQGASASPGTSLLLTLGTPVRRVGRQDVVGGC